MAFDPSGLDSYVDVPTRIAEFRDKHPDGSLQPVNPAEPFRIVEIGDRTFICYTAAAYRTPDDPRPGIGCAYEPFPGLTPYTRNSELMNAETSAWGRAIVAVLAADSRKIASAEEVRNRQAERDQPAPAPERAPTPARASARAAETDWAWASEFENRLDAACSRTELTDRWEELKAAVAAGTITETDAGHLKASISERRNELAATAAWHRRTDHRRTDRGPVPSVKPGPSIRKAGVPNP